MNISATNILVKMKNETKKLVFIRFINRVVSMSDFMETEKKLELLELGTDLSAATNSDAITRI